MNITSIYHYRFILKLYTHMILYTMLNMAKTNLTGGNLILIVAVLLGALFIFSPSTIDNISSDLSTADIGVGNGDFVNYNVGFTYQERLATSGASASTTSPAYLVFHSNGQSLSGITSLYGVQGVSIASGTSTTNVAIAETDDNTLIIGIDTGTAHYPDPSKILADNPSITSLKWIPVTSPNVPELVGEIDLSTLGSPNFNINPSVTTQLLVSVNADDVAVTMSSPSDQDSIGTVAGTDVYVTWEITALASDEAMALARVYITSAQTVAYIEALELVIDSSADIVEMSTFNNLGDDVTLSVAETATTSAGVAQYWRYFPLDEDVSTDYTNALMVARGSADADSILVRSHLQTSFASASNAETYVLGIKLVSAGNAVQTAVTDSVTLGG